MSTDTVTPEATDRAHPWFLRFLPQTFRFDGRLESSLVLLGVAGGMLFITLVATLFFIQRGLVNTQKQLATQALPAQQALGRVETALGYAFERQAKVAIAPTLAALAPLRDRRPIEAALSETETLIAKRFERQATRAILGALPEHDHAFLRADQELFESVERRLLLRETFQTKLSQIDIDLAELIQSAKALSGTLQFDHVLLLRRLAGQVRAGAPSLYLLRSEVVGDVYGRLDDVGELVQAVIGFGRLAAKVGLTFSEDALNSLAANELVQNRSLVEQGLAALKRGSRLDSDAGQRIAALDRQFHAISPRISDERREDSLVWLRRHILLESGRAIQVQKDCAASARLLTDDLARLDRISNQEANLAISSSTRTTARARLISLLVSMLGLAACFVLAMRIRTSIRTLRGTNQELADLRDNLELKVAARTSEVSASREQYRLLIETTKTIPFELGERGLAFTYIGPQAHLLFRADQTACLTPGFLALHLHPDDRDRTIAALGVFFADGAANVDFELRLQRTDGSHVWVRLIASVSGAARVSDRLSSSHEASSGGETATGKVLRGVLLDVTQTHELEVQLRQAQKLESVGRLASGVAHEINTPVQFVSDNVHFLKVAFGDLAGVLSKYQSLRAAVVDGTASVEMGNEVGEAEEEADISYVVQNAPSAIERSIEGLGRIAEIVRAMKEFAHPDQKEKTTTDLNQALASTLIIAGNEFKYVAELETDLGDIPPVLCHAGEINQVFLNIIVNASHAIGDVVKGTDQRGLIRVTTRRDDGDVVISIADTGGGIPESIRDRIFDPFFTTKAVGKGTGQGLAIARSVVVDKHGGEIRVQSEVGRGTTFFIRVPIGSKVRHATNGLAA